MTASKEIGEVKKIPFIQQIEWRIPDFFTVVEDETTYRSLVSSTFPVTDVLWHLRFWPQCGQMSLAWKSKKENSGGYRGSGARRECSLEYEFGLKEHNGIVKYLTKGIMQKNEVVNNHNYSFITKAQLLERRSELVPDNVLTIVCTMKWTTEVLQSDTRPDTVLDSGKTLKLIRLEKLSVDFMHLFGDKETSDVALKVQDKEYNAHKLVLIARSSVFAATFKHDTLERQTGIIIIPDCDPDSFQEFLEYLYSGKLKELSYQSALNLYYTSEKYDVEEIKSFCVEYLMQCLTVENMCEVVAFADKYEETGLITAVQKFFNKNACEIFETPEWDCLMKKNTRLASKLLKEMSKLKLKQ